MICHILCTFLLARFLDSTNFWGKMVNGLMNYVLSCWLTGCGVSYVFYYFLFAVTKCWHRVNEQLRGCGRLSIAQQHDEGFRIGILCVVLFLLSLASVCLRHHKKLYHQPQLVSESGGEFLWIHHYARPQSYYIVIRSTRQSSFQNTDRLNTFFCLDTEMLNACFLSIAILR